MKFINNSICMSAIERSRHQCYQSGMNMNGAFLATKPALVTQQILLYFSYYSTISILERKHHAVLEVVVGHNLGKLDVTECGRMQLEEGRDSVISSSITVLSQNANQARNALLDTNVDDARSSLISHTKTFVMMIALWP